MDLLQNVIFPLANIAACTISFYMFWLCWQKLGYLPLEGVFALVPLLFYGIGYILLLAGFVEDLVALRGVLFFLLISPGIAAYIRLREHAK